MSKSRFLKWMTETEEERLARQAEQARQQKIKDEKKELERLRKEKSDLLMIQESSRSVTDEHGRHHVTRSWKLVKLNSGVKAK